MMFASYLIEPVYWDIEVHCMTFKTGLCRLGHVRFNQDMRLE